MRKTCAISHGWRGFQVLGFIFNRLLKGGERTKLDPETKNAPQTISQYGALS